MIKDWEKRETHEIAIRFAIRSMHEEDVHTDSNGNALKPEPWMYRKRFQGKKFASAMEQMGHDSVVFENCKCKEMKC